MVGDALARRRPARLIFSIAIFFLVWAASAPYLDGMGVFIDIMIAVAMLAVVVSLGMGIFAMLKGGDYGRANSNKWMRRRVMTQFIAVALLTIGFAYKMSH